MKRNIDIVLQSIHLGSACEVVALSIDGKDPATKFLNQLKKKDLKAYKSLKTRIKAVSNYEHYDNQETFRNLGDGIFEFKRNTPKLIRLYAFYDEIEGIGKLILCTNGGDKRLQSQRIQDAKGIRDKYLDAKKLATTKLYFKESDE